MVAGGSVTLVVTVVPTSRARIDTAFSVLVRGAAEPLPVRVTASVDVPTLELGEDEYTFDEVVLGHTTSVPLSLSNRSRIPAHVIVDLTDQPDFELALAEEDIFESGRALTTNRELRLSGKLTRDETLNLYRIQVPPTAQAMQLRICSTPSLADTAYSFPLRLLLASGRPYDPPAAEALVSARTRHQMLAIDSSNVDFGREVLRTANCDAPHVLTKTLTLSNVDKEHALRWTVSLLNNDNGLFSLSEMSGMLACRDSQHLRVSATASTVGNHRATLAFQYTPCTSSVSPLSTQSCSLVPVTITCETPTVFFDMPHLILPPVPLRTTTTDMVRLMTNAPSPSRTLVARSPADCKRIPLHISFVAEHNTFDKTVDDGTLRVVVSLAAPHSVSFRALRHRRARRRTTKRR